MKTIVVSAVNLVEAGTLAILKDCLSFLSGVASGGEYRVVAVVYKRELADYPGIEYIETQWPKKRWVNRLWFEYVSMKKISKDLGPVYLWFSLHDTSPSVVAERRAVYCHNSFSFYKWKMHDWVFAPKIALFALFTKFIYQTNIKKNTFLVVQQEWFRKALANMFALPEEKIIVAPPQMKLDNLQPHQSGHLGKYSFIYAASPNSHKNFECICQAVEILMEKYGLHDFRVRITVKGDENKYARWLYKNWGEKYTNLEFTGFLSKQRLNELYDESSCLIFSSKVETWGLPISEFATYQKPMLLADLPYAHETAAGASMVAYFHPDRPEQLAEQMLVLIKGDFSALQAVPRMEYKEPFARDWQELFNRLLG